MQMTLEGFTTCDVCIYGRNLGGADWGCRSEKRRATGQLMVHNLNKEKYTCEFAEHIDRL